jgi:thiamine pyrophosphokinase
MKRCVIFCGGGFSCLDGAVLETDLVIAADKGLVYTQQLGLQPDLVLGDFDSLGYVPAGAQVHPVEKDDTDAMLAARQALEAGCREVILYGSLDGDRVDHTKANFQLLCFLAERGAQGTLVGIHQRATVVKNGSLFLDKNNRGNLSVFCMGDGAHGVSIRGAKYCVEDVTLCDSFPLGVSNSFVGNNVEISVKNGKLLIIWDR